MVRSSEAQTTDAVGSASNKVANAVHRRLGGGVGPVALLFDEGDGLARAVLGVVKAGCEPVLLPPTETPADHAARIAEVGACLLVADRAHLAGALDLAGRELAVVGDAALVEGASTAPLAVGGHAADESGAAGRPPRHGLDPGRPAGSLVQVQPGDPMRAPLFVAHDLDGMAERYRGLARALGDDQPLYAFESPFLHGDALPSGGIDTLVERYVAEMRRAQPCGPYFVAGYSYGGILAFELARRLERDGQAVAFVGVIDVGPDSSGTEYSRRRPPPSPWAGIRPPAEPDWPLTRKLKYHGSIAKRTPKAFVRHWAKRGRLDRPLVSLQWERDLRRHGTVRAGLRTWYSWQRLWELTAREWRPLPFRGDLTLLWSHGVASADPTLGWDEVVGGTVTVLPLDVEHRHVLADESVGILAGVLRSAFDLAAERHEPA